MVQAPATPFRFDFDDLRPPRSELRVVAATPASPETFVDVVPTLSRPRWLPRLLPIFPAGLPLHVEVVGESAFAGLLAESLAAVFATAGAEARVRVALVSGGFVAGSPRLDSLPAQPQVVLFPTDLTRPAVAAAIRVACGRPGALLVLNGSLPRLDGPLGIDAGLPLARMPLVGRGELEAVRRGIPAGLLRRGFGIGCLALARLIVAAYSQGLP